MSSGGVDEGVLASAEPGRDINLLIITYAGDRTLAQPTGESKARQMESETTAADAAVSTEASPAADPLPVNAEEGEEVGGFYPPGAPEEPATDIAREIVDPRPPEESPGPPTEDRETERVTTHMEESGTGEGGTRMYFTDQADEKVLIKTEQVVGHGTKQKLIEETKTIEATKIVDIVASLTNVRSIVKEGKVIVQGTLHKQIFYIGLDGLEHHLAEDIEWSDLVDIIPINPANPVRPGMNQQDHSIIENLIFEFDPATGQLTEKVIILLDVKVTETVELNILLGTTGPYIKTEKIIGRGTKQKFIREEKTIPGVKIVEIIPSLTNVRSHVKNGKVILQGNLHKQIFYVGTDNIVHHLAEDIPWSDLVEITPLDPAYPVREGMNEQDHSLVENLIYEFDPATGRLIQKVILKLDVVVTETTQIPVVIDPYGTLIKTPVVIGRGQKQKLIEETKTLEAVKIVEIVPSLVGITSVVKDGKVIVQGTLHKQIFYVGTDGLVHHLAEDIDWSELVEVPPLDPTRPVTEGMDQQDHSTIENLVFEFDPATGTLTEKVIIGIDVVVTSTEQIYVADP